MSKRKEVCLKKKPKEICHVSKKLYVMSAETGQSAAQNAARKRLMLSQLSRRGSGGAGGGLFGGGLSGIAPLMMLSGGGDGLGKMLMLSALTKGSQGGAQGGGMQQLLPLMFLTESGIM
uniref:Uncharacterized protein n=1 Tax=Magallana gigas TaxID=29159 RepID=K1QDT3_MAGGI